MVVHTCWLIVNRMFNFKFILVAYDERYADHATNKPNVSWEGQRLFIAMLCNKLLYWIDVYLELDCSVWKVIRLLNSCLINNRNIFRIIKCIQWRADLKQARSELHSLLCDPSFRYDRYSLLIPSEHLFRNKERWSHSYFFRRDSKFDIIVIMRPQSLLERRWKLNWNQRDVTRRSWNTFRAH